MSGRVVNAYCESEAVYRPDLLKAYLFCWSLETLSSALNRDAAQRTAALRGIGTQTCKSLVAASQTQKQLLLQALARMRRPPEAPAARLGQPPPRSLERRPNIGCGPGSPGWH